VPSGLVHHAIDFSFLGSELASLSHLRRRSRVGQRADAVADWVPARPYALRLLWPSALCCAARQYDVLAVAPTKHIWPRQLCWAGPVKRPCICRCTETAEMRQEARTRSATSTRRWAQDRCSTRHAADASLLVPSAAAHRGLLALDHRCLAPLLFTHCATRNKVNVSEIGEQAGPLRGTWSSVRGSHLPRLHGEVGPCQSSKLVHLRPRSRIGSRVAHNFRLDERHNERGVSTRTISTRSTHTRRAWAQRTLGEQLVTALLAALELGVRLWTPDFSLA
jgi:hypothetical protein